MNELFELGRDIAEKQDLRASEIDVERVAERLRASSRTVSSRRALRAWMAGPVGRWVAVGAAVAAAAAVALVLRGELRSLEYHVEGAPQAGRESSWISASVEPLPIGFSDGSRVVLGQGARARVTRLEKTGAEVTVEQGPVGVAIVPRKNNRWRIDLGPFVVEVTGTRFDVDWNPLTERFKLTMHEGKVKVTGCAIGSRAFEAGDKLEVSCREQKFHVTSPAHGETGSRIDDADLATQEPLPEPEEKTPPIVGPGDAKADALGEPRSGSPSSKWRALAEAGRYREALLAAEAAGFDGECHRASASDLLALAGAARLAGDATRAAQAYELLRKRFSSDPSAAVAAFNLARVAFDLSSDYPSAVRWFRTYLREQPNGWLAREAQGRLLEALQRSGDAAGARREAADYLARYPAGPHAEFAKRLAR
jgi:hypothetical protein